MKATWIIDQLICQGVEHFCIAPGSRSSPLALAVAKHEKAKTTVHFDERGLGFFALGIGKATKKPAAIITTSGTAIANLYPAILEASHSMTPLIILTADRPQELRFCGANQTIDQVKIFANAVREQTDLSPHLDEKATRSITANFVFYSLKNPPGPVHMNIPFREPLHIEDPVSRGIPTLHVYPQLSAPPFHTKAKKGIILLGPNVDSKPVLALAKRIQWPIFIDLLARTSLIDEQIFSYDTISKAPKPDLILHFGERLISKKVLEFAKGVDLIHVSPYPHLQDPNRALSTRIQSDIEPFCNTFSADRNPSWLKTWKALDITPKTLDLPQNRPIFFGNSLPIREADRLFFPKKAPLLFANRGVSGIDGNIATMAGIAEGLNTSITGYIGDQTALHDLNSLPLIKKHQLLIVISNNFGGKIFEHLPIKNSPYLEKFFTAPHDWSFKKAAEMFAIPYKKMKSLQNLPDWGIVELIAKENPLI